MVQLRTKQLKRIARKEWRNERKYLRKYTQSDLHRQNIALRRSRRSGVLYILIGAVLALFFAFVAFALVVASLKNPEEEPQLMLLGIVAFFSLFGLFISRKGIKKLHLRGLYLPYKVVLEACVPCSLSEFAAHLGRQTTEKQAQKRLLTMMKAGFFPGYSLHLTEKYIHHPIRETTAQNRADKPDCVYEEIPCPRCQAVNRVPEDAPGRCYCCGALL